MFECPRQWGRSREDHVVEMFVALAKELGEEWHVACAELWYRQCQEVLGRWFRVTPKTLNYFICLLTHKNSFLQTASNCP